MSTSTQTPLNSGSDVDPQLEDSSDEITQPERPVNDGSTVECEDFGQKDVFADDTQMQKACVDLANHYDGLEKFPRRTEVIEARRQRFYRRGDQYIYFNYQPNMMTFVPYSGGDENGAPGSDSPNNTEVYNIFWAYMRALISVGTQNPPGINFEPDDPTVATDINASKAAEVFRHRVDRINRRKKLQADIMSYFCTDGRTVVYTRQVRDSQKYGERNGEPVTVEKQDAFGVLEHKCVPITTDDPTQWVAQFLENEVDINLAKEMYPAYAGRITPQAGSAADQYERMARIGVLQGTRSIQNSGDAFAHLVTRQRIWLRPAAFNHAPDATRNQLKEAFPKGMKLVTCGGSYCGAFNQTPDDYLSVSWPAPGDGAAKPSMLKDLIAVQDAYNDYRNLEKEIFDFAIPATWCDDGLGDPEVLREQTSEPGNHVFAKRPDGLAALADAFYTEPPAGCPPSMIAAYQDLRGAFAQFISGAQPALFGAADKDNETASGISMLRDQAMGQFGIAWAAQQELFAMSYKQAAICRARSLQEGQDEVLNVKVPGRYTSIQKVAVANLQKGNFHAYPDLDSSFPETTGSKRQTLQAMVTQAFTNPEAIEAYGVLEPQNLEIQRQLLGVQGWTIPAANACAKQLGEIEELLEQRPVPNVGDIRQFATDQALEEFAKQHLASSAPSPVAALAVTGSMPEAPKPDPDQLFRSSIPVDKQWDFHSFEAETIKDWLSSPEGIEQKRTNKWGYLNVRLHGMEHDVAAAGQASMVPPGAAPPSAPNAGASPSSPATPMANGAPQAPKIQ